MATKLALICPCYNEEDVLEDSVSKLNIVFDELISSGKIDASSTVVIVNDGSKDSSWEIIKKIHDENARFKGINLAFNSGHQFAIMAGMMSVKDQVDAAITIDVDLQDDINCIEKMVDYFQKGYEVVYGVKNKRKADGSFKRLSAKAYYKMQKCMGINIVYNHADFRLVSNNVLKALSKFNETNLYLRGIIPSLGFKSTTVKYDIKERSAGESKYTGKKMLNLATNGVVGFSPAPLKIIVWIGIIFLIVALINAIDVIVALCNGSAQPGWSQLMLSIWFVGGIIMISIGMVGIYIGRTYSEVKKRPQYIISEVLD